MSNATKAKDPRRSFNRKRIEYGGNVWTINAKANPSTGILKVYRVEGDITNMGLLCEALRDFADSQGFQFSGIIQD